MKTKLDTMWLVLENGQAGASEWCGQSANEERIYSHPSLPVVVVTHEELDGDRPEIKVGTKNLCKRLKGKTVLCWVHFGDKDSTNCFSMEMWTDLMAKIRKNCRTFPDLSGCEFRPFTRGGSQQAWDKMLVGFKGSVPAGESPAACELVKDAVAQCDDEKRKTIDELLRAAWQSASKYRDWVLKKSAVRKAMIRLEQAALLYRLESEMRTSAASIRGASVVQDAIVIMGEELTAAGFLPDSFSCIGDLKRVSIDDAATFSKELSIAAVTIGKLMPKGKVPP